MGAEGLKWKLTGGEHIAHIPGTTLTLSVRAAEKSTEGGASYVPVWSLRLLDRSKGEGWKLLNSHTGFGGGKILQEYAGEIYCSHPVTEATACGET